MKFWVRARLAGESHQLGVFHIAYGKKKGGKPPLRINPGEPKFNGVMGGGNMGNENEMCSV